MPENAVLTGHTRVKLFSQHECQRFKLSALYFISTIQAEMPFIKEIIDTESSFADWLNNQIVRDQLKFDIKVCLIKNGYPPQYSPEVFRKVMEQVENFEENN